MSSALETLLEAARYIELQELRQQHYSQQGSSDTNIEIQSNSNVQIIPLQQQQSSYQTSHISNNSSSYNTNNNNQHTHNINLINSNNNNVHNNINNSIRYNNVLNSQLFISSPQVSPVSQTTNNTNININNNQIIQQRNEFNISNSNIIRIEARHLSEEPFVTNGLPIAPPLVVISQQPNNNNANNNNANNNNHNSLSPPSTSSSSFEISRSRSSSISSTNIPPSTTPTIGHNLNGQITTNGIYPIQNCGDDSNQSSLNLSNVSSGYISGSSANSSMGSTNLNLSNNMNSVTTNGILTISEQQHNIITPQSIMSNRRRTTSTNSNGGNQRSPCILRAGTREVHNKLEKNRRAHLKECFEQLKKQLPLMPEEKKTSNLSILGAAIRYVQTLKRKERELEHEMEKLAKEKIAAQQKILLLKRELSAQWDHIDFSTIIPEPDMAPVRVGEHTTDLSLLTTNGRSCPRYSSSSSLSSVATSLSPCTTIGLTVNSALSSSTTVTTNTSPVIGMQFNNNKSPHSITSITSPNLITSITNPNLISNINNNQVTLPLSLTPSTIKKSHHHHQMIEMSMHALHKKNNAMAINLTTSDGSLPSTLIMASSAGMPLHLNSHASFTSSPLTTTTSNSLISQSLQIISTNNNPKDLTKKNGIRVADIGRQEPLPGLMINKDISKVEVLTTKIETEPPTKVIKLINGSTIALTSLDKDNKIIGTSPTLTLQQVVNSGSLVVSPIPLITSSQGLRVIGQSPNGIATIELTTPLNQQSRTHQIQTHSSTCGANGPQLHKLLVSGTSSVETSSSTTVTPEMARLPGGAELNILPANSNGATLYRSQKLAYVNNGLTIKNDGNRSSRAVHVVTPLQSGSNSLTSLTPIVVPQGQSGANIAQILAASSSQLSGKVIAPLPVTGQNHLPLVTSVSSFVVKPMVVAVASSSTNSTSLLSSNVTTSTKSQPVTVTCNISNGNCT